MWRRIAVLLVSSAAVTLAAGTRPSVAVAQAETGSVVGTVADSLGQPLNVAQVTLGGSGRSGSTDAQGRFAIREVAPGSYSVHVRRIGHRPRTVDNVAVRAGEETRIDIVLEQAPAELAPLVVSASRRPEKVTEAPATITRIDAATIENSAGNSFAPALKGVPGLDYIQIGVTAVAVNARGFNSAFNNRMLLMEDNRIAVLPENGLPVGAFTTIPKVDLEAIEVLVGPGAALYGPDASNGVITLTTKDPRQYPGTTVEISGGTRSFVDVQARQAGSFGGGRFGYKLTGEYQRADDFENQNIYAPITTSSPPSPEIGADFTTNVGRVGGALVYYLPSGSRFELTGGFSQSNALGITNVGRNQLVDWQYRLGQLKFSHPNWFAQVYRTESRSGDTYQLNGFAQNRLRFPTISDDSVKHLSDFPAEGDLTAAELQNTFELRTLGGTRVTWGGQFRHDRVSSDRQWLLDRKTGEDITIDQIGGYAQVEVPVTNWLRVVGAGRYDKHDNYDGQFSPKAGVVVTPATDQAVRFTFNRAFKSPTVLQTSFFFPDFQPAVGVFGNPNGYVIRNQAGDVVRTINPIEPEINNTWELGYRGVLGQKLYVDVAGYYSRFEHFLSPLVIIANFLTPAGLGGPTFAFDAATGEQLAGSTGGPQIPLTYFNVGEAKVYGIDAGIRYFLNDNVSLSGSMSWQTLDTVLTSPGDPPEATAFNSPEFKMTLGANTNRFIVQGLSAGLTFRHTDGYTFISGVNNGVVPGFSTIDVQVGYDIPRLNTRLNLNVVNLFTCRNGSSTPNGWIAAGRPAIYTDDRQCGFDERHAEMLNSPALGTILFFGIRYTR